MEDRQEFHKWKCNLQRQGAVKNQNNVVRVTSHMPSPLMPRVVLLILIHGARMAPGAKLFFLWGMDMREGGMPDGVFLFRASGWTA